MAPGCQKHTSIITQIIREAQGNGGDLIVQCVRVSTGSKTLEWHKLKKMEITTGSQSE